MKHAFLLMLAYLLGSTPFGFLIVRFVRKADVRETGSGGTGATNVTRRAGKSAGLLTLSLDAAKGAAAIGFARWLMASDTNGDWWIAAAAIAAIIGHVFPVWLGFRGGKGVATGLGVFLCLTPLTVLFAALIFICVAWRTRYVSLASLCAVAALPFGVWFSSALFSRPSMDFAPLLTAAVACGALIVFMHRENIVRLRDGTENRFR